jgi:hypothetical protein
MLGGDWEWASGSGAWCWRTFHCETTWHVDRPHIRVLRALRCQNKICHDDSGVWRSLELEGWRKKSGDFAPLAWTPPSCANLMGRRSADLTDRALLVPQYTKTTTSSHHQIQRMRAVVSERRPIALPSTQLLAPPSSDSMAASTRRTLHCQQRHSAAPNGNGKAYHQRPFSERSSWLAEVSLLSLLIATESCHAPPRDGAMPRGSTISPQARRWKLGMGWGHGSASARTWAKNLLETFWCRFAGRHLT